MRGVRGIRACGTHDASAPAGVEMAQSIDRQGLDTLFVKARSLRKWVAGAEMVKVLEGADPD